jgi:peptide/nickel transport system substrate-binding protein
MKRKGLSLIIVTIFLLSFLVGNVVMAGSQSKPTGELRIVLPALWNEVLDPMLASSLGSVGLIAMYDPLVGAKPDGSDYDKETGLARDWELSPDGKVWTFHLRKGVQFHRGFGEVTAEDVKFTIERLKSERSMAARKGWIRGNIGKIQVVNKYTVKVHSTGKKIREFISLMSPLYASIEQLIVSKRAVEELGEDGFAKNPVGSGPYRFIEHVGGQYIKLEALENHWRIGTPRFEHVYFQAVPEEETAIAMLARGDADLVTLSRSNVKRIREKGIDLIIQKSMGGLGAWLDDQWVEGIPANNEKVREALNLAIDRQALVDEVLEGMGRPLGSYFVTSVTFENLGYNWREDLYPHDPEKARKLLVEAGYPDGFDIDVYIYPYTGCREAQEIMQLVAGMWSKIGIRPKIIPVDYGVVRSKLFSGKMPGGVAYWANRARPWQGMLGYYHEFLHSGGAITSVKSDELDGYLDTASGSLDLQEAKAALRKAIKYVRKHHHAMPLFEFDVAYGVSKKAKHWDPGTIPGMMNWDSLFRSQ